MARIAIIGGGNIGEALLSGLLRAGRQVKDLVVAEKDPNRAKYLAEKYGVLVTSVGDAAESATFIVIAVKPGDVEKVIDDIAEAAARADSGTDEQVFVSVAAGVGTGYYEAKLPAGAPVVRVMPNAPMVVGGGVSALAPGRFATPEQLKEVAGIFDAVGGVLTVTEAQMDAVTAVSGSGPAYFFLLAEALIDAGVEQGLPRDVAVTLATGTALGAGAMLTGGGEGPAELRYNVSSPGGTTARAIRRLESGGVRAAVADAVEAAATRSRELAQAAQDDDEYDVD